MSNEQNGPRFSARSGFLLGIGTTAVIGALVLLAFRYDGGAKATVTPPSAPLAAPPAATQTFPLAEHVAAMSQAQDQTTARAALPQSSSKAQSVLLSGTIELDQSIANSVSGTVTVFVIARDKKGKGHPILAKRIDVASFPTKFSLGSEDSMMGGAPPDHVSLEARIDLDHDAMTREPGVPAAKIESVAIGTTNVTLTLKKE
jgi:hypothetical protein